jgi:hypothetical protein
MSANLSWRCEEVAFAVSFVPFKFSAASRVARCEGLGLSIFSQALAPFRCSLLSQHDNATKPNRESRQKFESTIGSCSQTLKGKFRPKVNSCLRIPMTGCGIKKRTESSRGNNFGPRTCVSKGPQTQASLKSFRYAKIRRPCSVNAGLPIRSLLLTKEPSVASLRRGVLQLSPAQLPRTSAPKPIACQLVQARHIHRSSFPVATVPNICSISAAGACASPFASLCALVVLLPSMILPYECFPVSVFVSPAWSGREKSFGISLLRPRKT